MFTLKGTTVTVDALNCPREIAEKIVDQSGDYVLGLKTNQGALLDDVSRFLDDPESEISTVNTTVDGDHGHIETHTATVAIKIDRLQDNYHLPGLAGIGKVIRTRQTQGKTTTEMACYLQSTARSGEHLNQAVRSHWGVENRLHWRLDVVINEDQDRTRLDNGPTISPCFAIWRSTTCSRTPPKGPCAASSCEQNGMSTSSPGFSHCSEMRLPYS